MEAENYTDMRASTGVSYWDYTNEPADYSGTDAMQAQPADYVDHKDITNAQANAYVWARSSHVDGYDDSVWFGKDLLIEGTDPLSYTTDEQPFADEWYWICHTMSGGIATLNIETTGVHTFEIYMREPHYKIDKIILTTNPDYIAGDDDPMGPPETLVDTNVKSYENSIPTEFSLAQNYPNPFNPVTTIAYSLPSTEFVTLTIYNLAGEEVARIVNTSQTAGTHQITWSAEGFASGMYFYKLQAGQFSATKKLLVQK